MEVDRWEVVLPIYDRELEASVGRAFTLVLDREKHLGRLYEVGDPTRRINIPADLADRHERLRHMVQQLEWVGGRCPVCGGFNTDAGLDLGFGHDIKCELASVLYGREG